MVKFNFKKNRNRLEGPPASAPRPDVPSALCVPCPACEKTLFATELEENSSLCPKCGYHFRMKAQERMDFICDNGTFEALFTEVHSCDPLRFPGYAEKLATSREKGLVEVVCGRAKVGGVACCLFAMNPDFMMGSMGSATGEKITRLFEFATQARLPVVGFTLSGGARMQEGVLSLMQMAKVSGAVKYHSDAGLLYVAVLCDPTTGGVTASFAMEGDILLAEPGALIAFAGPRVIEQTLRQKLPKNFQKAEFLLEKGFLDAVIPRGKMRATLTQILQLHTPDASAKPGSVQAEKNEDMSEKQAARLQSIEGAEPGSVQAEKNEGMSEKQAARLQSIEGAEPGSVQAEKNEDMNENGAVGSAKTAEEVYAVVKLARASGRASGKSYIKAICREFIELRGDRRFADDHAIIGGIGRLQGMPITVIAHERGNDINERARRNFGMAHPEGYRKALRLMKQAEKFGRPVLCLVDTSGAYCGIGAEERGQGQAIAENLMEMMTLKVPVVSLLMGEGGSGGALALAVADRVWMMQNSVYSVISPEGCASILYKDARKADEAALRLKLTPPDLLALGVIEEILPEVDDKFERLKVKLLDTYAELEALPEAELRRKRYERFRQMGCVAE